MSTNFGILCKHCGAHAVHPRARAGRTFLYRNLVPLPIPADFAIATCGRCQREAFDPQTLAKLMPLLEEEYRQLLRRRIRQVIERVVGHISQRRLEHLLGLSQGYLSRLRSGASIPSTELVGHLALLASDPEVRLRELERFWREPWPIDVLDGGGPPKAGAKEDIDPTR